ncbi:uncharacterized protein [Amphiura filiformis]|uniref:uncharacterized protein n=1 Tax=Amphiura filiformis TaxID=82378 RepID=UPI003B21592E
MKLLKPFCCKFCRMTHYSLDTLKIHVSRHQIKYVQAHKRIKCMFCQKILSKNGRLRRHLNNHRKLDRCSDLIGCSNDCDLVITHKLLRTSSPLKTDSRSDIKQKPYPCDYCQQSFSSKRILKSHRNSHTKEKLYQCEYCQKCFGRKASLTSHIRTHTKEKPYQCEYCQKCFTQKANLVSHVSTHTKEKCFQCDYCKKTFSRVQTLKIHEKLHTVENPYQCQYCQKCFTTSSNLNSHVIKTHTKAKPYQCEYCQKSFLRDKYLKTHRKLHTENLCQCADGTKRVEFRIEDFTKYISFITKLAKNLGMKVHKIKLIGQERVRMVLILQIPEGAAMSRLRDAVKRKADWLKSNKVLGVHIEGESYQEVMMPLEKEGRQFKCPDCDYASTARYKVRTHQRVHVGTKPYQCPFCTFVCTFVQSLERHKRIHSGQKPYKCQSCGKSFTGRSGFIDHIRMHANEKQHQCRLCERSFVTSSQLKSHHRIHSKEAPYKCDKCNKAFKWKSSIKVHSCKQ